MLLPEAQALDEAAMSTISSWNGAKQQTARAGINLAAVCDGGRHATIHIRKELEMRDTNR